MKQDSGRAIGRPTNYKPEYCQMLVEHMKQGLSFSSFGGVVGASKPTLFRWLEHFPDFREAKELGESHSLLVWEKMGMVLIARGGGNGSAATYIYNMKNRFGWTNDPKLNQSDDPSGSLEKQEAARPKTLDEMQEILRIARGEKK